MPIRGIITPWHLFWSNIYFEKLLGWNRAAVMRHQISERGLRCPGRKISIKFSTSAAACQQGTYIRDLRQGVCVCRTRGSLSQDVLYDVSQRCANPTFPFSPTPPDISPTRHPRPPHSSVTPAHTCCPSRPGVLSMQFSNPGLDPRWVFSGEKNLGFNIKICLFK